MENLQKGPIFVLRIEDVIDEFIMSMTMDKIATPLLDKYVCI